MRDYLRSIAARTLGLLPVVRPVVPSRFEPGPSLAFEDRPGVIEHSRDVVEETRGAGPAAAEGRPGAAAPVPVEREPVEAPRDSLKRDGSAEPASREPAPAATPAPTPHHHPTEPPADKPIVRYREAHEPGAPAVPVRAPAGERRPVERLAEEQVARPPALVETVFATAARAGTRELPRPAAKPREPDPVRAVAPPAVARDSSEPRSAPERGPSGQVAIGRVEVGAIHEPAPAPPEPVPRRDPRELPRPAAKPRAYNPARAVPAHAVSRDSSEPRPAPERGPSVQITIGRVEVRAIHEPAPAPPKPAPRRGPRLTLDEYAQSRKRSLE